MYRRLKYETKTIKLLEIKILTSVRSKSRQKFLGLTPNAQYIKGKISKLDLIKMKNFSSVIDPVKRVKR